MDCSAHFIVSLEQGWDMVGHEVSGPRVILRANLEGNTNSPRADLIHNQAVILYHVLEPLTLAGPLITGVNEGGHVD